VGLIQQNSNIDISSGKYLRANIQALQREKAPPDSISLSSGPLVSLSSSPRLSNSFAASPKANAFSGLRRLSLSASVSTSRIINRPMRMYPLIAIDATKRVIPAIVISVMLIDMVRTACDCAIGETTLNCGEAQRLYQGRKSWGRIHRANQARLS